VEPFSDAQAAKGFVESYRGDVADFCLPIDDALQDPHGLHMALILDSALGRGWMPDGYEQKDGFRIYRYKSAD
jgi:hypothetical protein